MIPCLHCPCAPSPLETVSVPARELRVLELSHATAPLQAGGDTDMGMVPIAVHFVEKEKTEI